jgi:hypothetical protein
MTRKSLRHIGLRSMLIAGVSLGFAPAGAWALECPAPQQLGDSATVPPDLTRQLSSDDVLEQVPGILGALHQQFPNATKQQLVDYLIAAYCPVVKGDAEADEDEKKAELKEFADSLIAVEY